MNVRIVGAVREMHALISREGKRWFDSATSGLHPLYDRNYDRFRVLFVRGPKLTHSNEGEVSFEVAVRMFVRRGRPFSETLTIGTGRSIDGRDLDLVVNSAQPGI